MFVREAVVCLDCDMIYRQEEEFCPCCTSRGAVELRQYFPAKNILAKEDFEKMARQKSKQVNRKEVAVKETGKLFKILSHLNPVKKAQAA
ncbi:MAG: hypothetical protein PHO03_01815 [Candidatus Omnitrophica bacterium]|jgi:hypothetical protein|uniref:hypothetical protein n=1 Tax=Shewanella sp. TaxID=50422 RepID=UPI002A27B76E|nr:hypothetical protein [Candidatus Omnitrophota bacterium]